MGLPWAMAVEQEMLQCLKRWPEWKQHVMSMERTSARWEQVEEEKGGGGNKHFQKSCCEGQREEQLAGGGCEVKGRFIYLLL